MLRILVILLAIPLSLTAGDADSTLPDTFDSAIGRRPVAGEWLEYLVAYPIDPLENSLVPNPVPPPSRSDANQPPPVVTDEYVIHQPISEPFPAWRVLPLRMVLLTVEDNGYRVAVTFAGTTREHFWPAQPESSNTRAPAFQYDMPLTEQTAEYRVGGERFDALVTKRHGENLGFIRLHHHDIPFGIARFATADIDLILVGMGTNAPPDFPLRLPEQPHPPPGALYGGF